MVRGLFASGGCCMCKKESAEQFHLCESCLETLSFIGEEIYSEKSFPVYALLRENRAASYMIEGLKFREDGGGLLSPQESRALRCRRLCAHLGEEAADSRLQSAGTHRSGISGADALAL